VRAQVFATADPMAGASGTNTKTGIRFR